MVWEPFVDDCDVDGGFVADGELLVAGGDGAVALEAVDAAFDGVALFVVFGIEGGRAAAVPAFARAVADLVGLVGDGAPDAASAQVSAVGGEP